MENTKQLRPIGELLTNTWDFYWLNSKKIIYLMLFGLIGIIPYAVMIAINVTLSAHLLVYERIIGLVILIFYIFSLYWILSTSLGFLILIKNPDKKIIDVFNEGRKLIWGDLAIGMIMFLIISLWSLLFVIPGIIFMVFYSFALFVFVYDGYRRSAALARSKELVKGNWWAVFGRILLSIIIILVFATLFGAVLNASHASPAIVFISQAVYYLITFFLISPLLTIYLAEIYRDLTALKPTSALPKEKEDYWLVILSTIIFILTFFALFYLIATMLASVF